MFICNLWELNSSVGMISSVEMIFFRKYLFRFILPQIPDFHKFSVAWATVYLLMSGCVVRMEIICVHLWELWELNSSVGMIIFRKYLFRFILPQIAQIFCCSSNSYLQMDGSVVRTEQLERNSCSKKESVFTCNLWENKIIIRVQKKQSTQVPHTNAEPRRTTFILSVMSGDYLSHLPTRPLPLLLYITSQPSCHSQYTYHEASC